MEERPMGEITLRVDELLNARGLQEGKRLELSEVAQATGIAPDVVAAMVDGSAEHVGLRDLARLCDYLGCTPDMLLHYEADATSSGAEQIESRDIVARWERTFGADER